MIMERNTSKINGRLGNCLISSWRHLKKKKKANEKLDKITLYELWKNKGLQQPSKHPIKEMPLSEQ